MKLNNVKVYDLEESIKASKYPMAINTETCNHEITKTVIALGNSGNGEGHDNFLNGIRVAFDLTFSNKGWVELERYHFFDFVSSCSTMHRLKSMDLDKGYCEHVDKRVVEIMKELQKEYNENPTQENMYRMLYTNPCGLKLTARMTTNYLQLKTIYWQRRNHRLKEWQDFCKWIETLPHAKELICGE